MFAHVDTADTRQWGATRVAASLEYDEIRKVLQPKLSALVSYSPPADAPPPCQAAIKNASKQQGARTQLCYASDCGTFGRVSWIQT